MNPAEQMPRVDVFLARYIRAFSPSSGVPIASLYHCPCMLIRGNGVIQSLQTESDVASFFEPVAEALWDGGTTNWDYAGLRVVPVGEKSCLISVTWSPLRADGSAIKSWDQSYNLIMTAGGWKVILSTYHIAS